MTSSGGVADVSKTGIPDDARAIQNDVMRPRCGGSLAVTSARRGSMRRRYYDDDDDVLPVVVERERRGGSPACRRCALNRHDWSVRTAAKP